jgi:hypothetical protein
LTAPATLGTPCLVPVQVAADGRSVRGFITRLSRSNAAVSTDPELPTGEVVSLRFRRPTDNEEVEITGTVSGLLPGGGLWRGRSAALVDLDSALDDEFFGGPELAPEGHRRRGSEADTPPAQARAGTFGDAFRAGLGRRRRASTPAALAPNPPRGRETGRRMAALSDAWAPVSGENAWDGVAPDEQPTVPPIAALHAEDTAPPVSSFPGEHTSPPLADSSSLETPRGLLASDSLPPVRATHPELAPADIDPFEALVGTGESALMAADDSVEDDFFGQFGKVQDLPDYNLPPTSDQVPGTLSGMEPVSAHHLTDLTPGPDGLGMAPVPGTLMELEPLDSLDVPAAPGLAADGYFDVEDDRVAEADAPGDTSFGDLLNTGAAKPVVAPAGDAPPVQDPSLSLGTAPWESDDRAAMSLIPRNARIASAIPVTFWARGRSNQATAQNFSKEGLFLATKDTPPVRGAIVRIEFPIEGEGEPVPVRFNAEVRWHQSDRPHADLPEGFGVQILTFESPKDRVRYDELLLLILTLSAERDREEARGFKWGRSGGSS